MTNDIWKPLTGWEGYYLISSTGRLKRLRRVVNYKSNGKIKVLPEKMVNPEIVRGGYMRYKLTLDGQVKHMFVHRAVAVTFLPNPNNKPCVNHIDGNPLNNKIDNLEWATYSENELHSHRVLGKKMDFPRTGAWKPIVRIRISNGDRKEYRAARFAVEEGFLSSKISECANGIRKTYRGFRWEFLKTDL